MASKGVVAKTRRSSLAARAGGGSRPRVPFQPPRTGEGAQQKGYSGLQKVTITNLRDAAFSALQKAFIRGEFEPGEQLDLHRIAKDLGISVTPVKEAVALLEHYGLVEIRARRGTCLRAVTAEALRQACEGRLVLECWAGTCFSTRALPEERDALKATLERLNKVTTVLQSTTKDAHFVEIQEQYSELDFSFHSGIIAAAHNEYIAHAYESLATPLVMARVLALAARDVTASRLVTGQIEHWQIYDALVRSNVREALREIERHVDISTSVACEVIQSKGGAI